MKSQSRDIECVVAMNRPRARTGKKDVVLTRPYHYILEPFGTYIWGHNQHCQVWVGSGLVFISQLKIREGARLRLSPRTAFRLVGQGALPGVVTSA